MPDLKSVLHHRLVVEKACSVLRRNLESVVVVVVVVFITPGGTKAERALLTNAHIHCSNCVIISFSPF